MKEYEISEQDQADAMLRPRSLVYVAATRARDVLAVTWSGEAVAIAARVMTGTAMRSRKVPATEVPGRNPPSRSPV